MAERNDNFRRDFETADEYHKRLDAEAAERATFEPDLGKVLEETSTEPPSPFIVDAGPYTSRRDREAIQAEQDRWTRLERMGR